MNNGICTVSVAPLRAEASHRAEMISQLLYGETVDLLEDGGKFLKVKMHFDGYEGWIDAQQISLVTAEYLSRRTVNVIRGNFLKSETSIGFQLLSAGSEISEISTNTGSITDICQTALNFLNVPYLWSGRSFFGIDCSGFVQLVYKIHGHIMPRDAYQQAEIGDVLSFVDESKAGDLAFFDNEEGQITHVGILLNHHEIIHAFGKVRIDSLDSSGIFNKELNRHTHRLRFIRSILPNK